MFNLFKKKIELKNEKCIMESIHEKKSFKIGSEIVVPDNYECLIYHKNKLFNALNTGKYKLDKSSFSALIDSQQTLKFKTKHIKLISYYISIGKQELEFKFKKQKFKVSFNIDNSTKFADLILLYTYKVDNDYVVNYLIGIFKELLSYHQCKYNQISNNALSNYGINIDNFELINGKSSLFKNTSSTKSINNEDNQNSNQTEKNLNSHNNQENKKSISNTTIQPSFPTCPKCGNSVKFKTTYCLKCGYKLEN